MSSAVVVITCLFATVVLVAFIRSHLASGDRERLWALVDGEFEQAEGAHEEIDWAKSEALLDSLKDRLGRAGYMSIKERRVARYIQITCLGAPAVGGVLMGVLHWGVGGGAVAGGIGLYLGVIAWLFYLRYRESDFNREVLFQTPLFLEGLILLVESGLGILPAMQQLVTSENNKKNKNPVSRILHLAYQLCAHGMPLSQALHTVASAIDSKVLRHVLLHLDITGSEGGELVPALRGLSEHAHTEWRLSVEARVKRLENLVVFPVFTSVIGLMLLIAAVPLVPILDFGGAATGLRHAAPTAVHQH